MNIDINVTFEFTYYIAHGKHYVVKEPTLTLSNNPSFTKFSVTLERCERHSNDTNISKSHNIEVHLYRRKNIKLVQ